MTDNSDYPNYQSGRRIDPTAKPKDSPDRLKAVAGLILSLSYREMERFGSALAANRSAGDTHASALLLACDQILSD